MNISQLEGLPQIYAGKGIAVKGLKQRSEEMNDKMYQAVCEHEKVKLTIITCGCKITMKGYIQSTDKVSTIFQGRRHGEREQTYRFSSGQIVDVKWSV